MTTEQTMLVKNSWKKLRNVRAETIGDLFYTKLFFDHPGLRRVFPLQMDQQNKKLVDMLSYIVLNIDDFQAVKKKSRHWLYPMGNMAQSLNIIQWSVQR